MPRSSGTRRVTANPVLADRPGPTNPPLPSLWADLARFDGRDGFHDGGDAVDPVEITFHFMAIPSNIPEQMSDEPIQVELADEEIQAEPGPR